MFTESARAPLRHLTIAYVAVNAAVFALSRPAAMAYGLHEVIGVVFLAAGLYAIYRDDDDTARYGVRMEGVFPGRKGDARSLVRTLIEAVPSALREVGLAGAAALVVLPVYTALWPLFNRVPAARSFTLTPERWRELLTQVIAVAFTEELFFRGYVQTRLADAWGLRADDGRLPLRAAAGPIVVASALFALTHVVVDPTVARAAVFFPGLLFGALRAWRGGIGAAVALHAAFNVWETYLEGR